VNGDQGGIHAHRGSPADEPLARCRSLVAVLIGGVLLGIIGALVVIPVAAAIRLLLHEIAIRRLDRS
jgi:hypothetical protein